MANIVEQTWIKDGAGGRMDDDGIITFNESTIIKFDEVVTDTQEAINSAGFQQGEEHRDNFNLSLTGAIEANPLDETNGGVWRFDLEYSTASFGLGNVRGNPNPRAEIEIGTWTYSQIVESDKDTGKAIANTAGDPFDPMPEEIIAQPVIRVTLKQGSAKIDRVEKIGSINDSQIRIAGINFPQYTAMLAAYESKPIRDEGGFLSFNNTYTIKGNFKVGKSGSIIGWQLELLNTGFNEIVNGKYQGIQVEEQTNKGNEGNDGPKYAWVPIAQPAMLDGNGKSTTDPSIASYTKFLVHKKANFSSFGLPSNFPVN